MWECQVGKPISQYFGGEEVLEIVESGLPNCYNIITEKRNHNYHILAGKNDSTVTYFDSLSGILIYLPNTSIKLYVIIFFLIFNFSTLINFLSNVNLVLLLLYPSGHIFQEIHYGIIFHLLYFRTWHVLIYIHLPIYFYASFPYSS